MSHNEAQHPLKGYYLTRVYKGDHPFTTIMDEIREEAIALCEKLRPERQAGEPGQTAYYDARAEVEDWLRVSAESSGVNIQAQHPVYFVLTQKPEVSVPGRQVISIPAEMVDLSCCSFTFDDSFVNRYPEGEASHPLRGVVLNAEQVSMALKVHGVMGRYDAGERYIEVQMWGRHGEAPVAASAHNQKRNKPAPRAKENGQRG